MLTEPSCPCLTCSIKIAQVGITEVVYHRGYYMDAKVRQVNEDEDPSIADHIVDSSCFQPSWS
jgi:deoxycytidylate deaminase